MGNSSQRVRARAPGFALGQIFRDLAGSDGD